MTVQSNNKVAHLTGCATGFGLLTALALARNGWDVCATMRNEANGAELIEKASRGNSFLSVKKLDVTDLENVQNVVVELEKEKNRIDLLINNAGYGLIGALEDTDLEQIRDQFDTNVFGCIRMIQAVMPIFRRQNRGHIINITSVAGLIGMPLYGAYCASKFALEGLSEALRFECALYNVTISNVEPGPYSTNFATSSLRYGARALSPTSPYARFMDYFTNRTKQTRFSDPQKVANLIVDIADGKRTGFWNPIGSRVGPLFLFKRFFGIETTQKLMRFLMKVPDKCD